MHACKAIQALRQLFGVTAVLLLLSAWTNATENRSCEQLLPLPNFHADVIIIGKLVQIRADEHSIDVHIVDTLKGKLPLSDCWQPFGETKTIRVNTSTLPKDCGGIEDSWSEYIFSLSASDAHRCPFLAYDGVHRPILPAHSKEERTRLRRQSSLCKLYTVLRIIILLLSPKRMHGVYNNNYYYSAHCVHGINFAGAKVNTIR